jgi:hypothetical protein
MVPVVLGQVLVLPDVLTNNHFSLSISDLPGGGDAEAFRIRNMTAVLPKKSISVTQAVLHRHKVHFPNRQDFGESFTATFMEAADRKIMNGLKGWQATIINPQTGLPFPKALGVRNGAVEVYNSANLVAERRTFFNMWPSDIAEIALDGSTENAPIVISVTFTYDAWE